jgi:hypothetical protein
MLLVLLAILLVGAYANNVLTTRAVVDVSRDAVSSARSAATGGRSPNAALALAEIGAAQKELLDSNSVQFLFEIMMLVMGGAGVYLLGRTWANAKRAEDEVGKAKKTVSDGSRKVGAMSAAIVATWHYQRVKDVLERAAVGPLSANDVSVIRDALVEVNKQLQIVKEGQGYLDLPTFNLLQDLARPVKTKLISPSISSSLPADVSERSATCLRVLDILKPPTSRDPASIP